MTKTRKPIVEKVEEKKESKIVDTSDDDDTNIFNDVDTEEDKTALYEKARALIKKADKERKTAVKKILEENGSGLFNADYEINVYKKIIKIDYSKSFMKVHKNYVDNPDPRTYDNLLNSLFVACDDLDYDLLASIESVNEKRI